jgi:hypothetical protein
MARGVNSRHWNGQGFLDNMPKARETKVKINKK